MTPSVAAALLACALAAAPTPETPAAEPAPAPSGEAAAPAAPRVLGLSLGVKAALLVPSGRTTGIAATRADEGTGALEASHSATVTGALALGYTLPFLQRAVSLRAEAGLYPLWGQGTLQYPADPDFGTVDYAYKSLHLPILLGFAVRLPLPLPVTISPELGFAAAWSRVVTTWTQAGASVETRPVTGWALGFYVGVEGAYALGPGALTAELRYVNARTDLGLRSVPAYGGAYNRELGDVQGTNVLLGYRLDL